LLFGCGYSLFAENIKLREFSLQLNSELFICLPAFINTEVLHKYIIIYLSWNLEDIIITELRTLGHKVRNIINVKHRQTKEPLNIFFIDLEPVNNNKDIYEVTAIQNKIVHIEPPRSTKPHIPQCVRCQQYGHTRKYCNKPFNCVKCGGPHNSATCTKPRDSPAKCGLCGGPHPANYKGCEQYHNILNEYNPQRLIPTNRSIPPSQENFPPSRPYNRPPTQHHQQQTRRSFEEVVNHNTTPADAQTSILKTFLDNFRGLFTQLTQQNGVILTMLIKSRVNSGKWIINYYRKSRRRKLVSRLCMTQVLTTNHF
jgi:hypothetical protein